MSEKNKNLPQLFKGKDKTGIEFIKKWPIFYEEMQQELSKTDNFVRRLEIVVDTIENIFRITSGKRVLSYQEYANIRRNKKRKGVKSFKNKKRNKKWKK